MNSSSFIEIFSNTYHWINDVWAQNVYELLTTILRQHVTVIRVIVTLLFIILPLIITKLVICESVGIKFCIYLSWNQYCVSSKCLQTFYDYVKTASHCCKRDFYSNFFLDKFCEYSAVSQGYSQIIWNKDNSNLKAA